MMTRRFPYNMPVASRYGAPMSRLNVGGALSEPTWLNIRRVPFIGGDYDRGGAYWGGGGETLYCVWSSDRSFIRYLRAPTTQAVRDAVCEENDGCVLWRDLRSLRQ